MLSHSHTKGKKADLANDMALGLRGGWMCWDVLTPGINIFVFLRFGMS
jgi:hypothetical protein